MTIEIKTATLEPIRNTYEHTRRRFGDKPASRYQEASYDIAPEKNFHYRPTWQPDKLLNDTSRTAVVMEDWYSFRDPRQYYYGTYVQARAKLQEVTESNYSFFEKRGLAAGMSRLAPRKAGPNLGVVLGPDAPEKSRNLQRNLREGRIQVVQGYFTI